MFPLEVQRDSFLLMERWNQKQFYLVLHVPSTKSTLHLVGLRILLLNSPVTFPGLAGGTSGRRASIRPFLPPLVQCLPRLLAAHSTRRSPLEHVRARTAAPAQHCAVARPALVQTLSTCAVTLKSTGPVFALSLGRGTFTPTRTTLSFAVCSAAWGAIWRRRARG